MPTDPTPTETPEQYTMGVKPPPVNFDMIEDLGRICASIQSMAELGGRKADEQTLRRLSRLIVVERELRQIVHADILHKRTNNLNDGALFPHVREFDDVVAEGGGVRLIVQDLQAVWDGTKWVGDGACTLNKWGHGSSDVHEKGRSFKRHHYSASYPKRALIMHSSWSPWGVVGERLVSGRWFIPPVQNFSFDDVQPGHYITGELYVEIC